LWLFTHGAVATGGRRCRIEAQQLRLERPPPAGRLRRMTMEELLFLLACAMALTLFGLLVAFR
jgi:hypothetical protein